MYTIILTIASNGTSEQEQESSKATANETLVSRLDFLEIPCGRAIMLFIPMNTFMIMNKNYFNYEFINKTN